MLFIVCPREQEIKIGAKMSGLLCILIPNTLGGFGFVKLWCKLNEIPKYAFFEPIDVIGFTGLQSLLYFANEFIYIIIV